MRRRSASTDLVASLVALAIGLASCERIPAWSASDAAIVSDAAGLLSDEQRSHMERYHQRLLGDHDLDYRVEMAEGVGDLDRYANTFRNALICPASSKRNWIGLLFDSISVRVRRLTSDLQQMYSTKLLR